MGILPARNSPKPFWGIEWHVICRIFGANEKITFFYFIDKTSVILGEKSALISAGVRREERSRGTNYRVNHHHPIFLLSMKEYQKGQDLHPYNVFLCGDVSGIQPFIFNIRSEGAAKTLKARSFFVGAITDLCIARIEERLGQDQCLLFYNGGGSFYVFCRISDEATLQDLRSEIWAAFARADIHLCLSAVKFDADGSSSSEVWKTIHQQAGRDKLRKFDSYAPAFAPFAPSELDFADDETWRKFAKKIIESNRFQRAKAPRSRRVESDAITLFGLTFCLSKEGEGLPEDVNWHLPLWDKKLIENHRAWVDRLNEENKDEDGEYRGIAPGHIIEFATLGYFAETRTGTDNIAVLKMDVDSLGDQFTQQADDWPKLKGLSDALKTFFEKHLYRLWEEGTFKSGSEEAAPFRENIYPIFAGGDDCMMIGAWDAIFEFAVEVREKFGAYVKEKCQEIGIGKVPTLSGAIVMVDSKYPVVRMSILSEEALKAAKSKPGKNSISVFGRVLTWREFSDARDIARTLEKIILDDQGARRILQYIRNSHLGFEKLMRQAVEKGTIHNPAVWRLLYYIRGDKKDLAGLEGIVRKYQEALLKAAIKGETTNPELFPVAARWAEFKTRKERSKPLKIDKRHERQNAP